MLPMAMAKLGSWCTVALWMIVHLTKWVYIVVGLNVGESVVGTKVGSRVGVRVGDSVGITDG